MSPASASQKLIAVGADGHVSAEDVLFLRRNVFADGVVSREELAALFKLGERAPTGAPEWAQYFEEAGADFFLREEEPHGYLTDEEFSLLKTWTTADGAHASALELGLLLSLMEKAVSTPDALSEFVGGQLKRLVLERAGGARIERAVVDLLRRLLYAAGGAGATAITREEAELLFDLNDATASAENDPAWSELFIKAIAAHLMAHVGYKPLPREEALRLQAWANDRTEDRSGFRRRMIEGGIPAILKAYTQKSVVSKRNEDFAVAAAIAEQVTAQEAEWLADRIGANGRLQDTEKVLLAYMKELGAELPPKLRDLVASAA